MFCNQCEQAANGTGCNISGVCGKKPEVATLQDHLIYGLKSLALYADKLGRDQEIDRFTIEGLFTTVTNVDFDPAVIGQLIQRCYQLKEKAKAPAPPRGLPSPARLPTGSRPPICPAWSPRASSTVSTASTLTRTSAPPSRS